MRCLIASLPVLALACGGSVSPIDPSSLKIEGSYDFTVSDVTVTNQQGCCTPPPNAGHPAIGQHARLDIRKNGAGFDAVITPEFADPQTMTVTVGTDGTVTLQGQVNFNGSSTYGSTSDELDTIQLAVGSDGHFAGSFTATGQENIFEGDVGWNAQASATGAIGADARPPQAQANAIASAPSVVLPWDALSARISEPVDQKALASAITLSPSSGKANVSWQVGGAVDWLGGVSVTGYRTSWSDFSGSASLGVAGGLADPSGNVSSTIGMQLQFLDVPKAATFAGGTVPAMWGAAQVATTTESCGTAGACIEIGPLDGPCSVQAGGIAGRLDASGGGSKLEITFRARAVGQYGQPYMMGGIGIEVATPGNPSQWVSDQALNPSFQQTADTQYPYASDWVTADIALPVSGSEIGFAVLPFGTSSTYCGGGPALPPITLVLDVAKVAVVP